VGRPLDDIADVGGQVAWERNRLRGQRDCAEDECDADGNEHYSQPIGLGSHARNPAQEFLDQSRPTILCGGPAARAGAVAPLVKPNHKDDEEPEEGDQAANDDGDDYSGIHSDDPFVSLDARTIDDPVRPVNSKLRLASCEALEADGAVRGTCEQIPLCSISNCLFG
jgi:hypothetical protein